MNAHQRRKFLRRHCHTPGSQCLLIRNWKDLAKVPDSKTHRLVIDVRNCNGWIKKKDNPEALGHYLSTHTFYGSTHKRSTWILRKCGFNVTLTNWDDPNAA